MVAVLVALLLSGCRFFGGAEPTRTPIPTFTPTPILVVIPAGAVPATSDAQQTEPEPPLAAPAQATQPAASTPTPVATPIPTATSTNTPAPTPTATPSSTPTPMPTPTPVPDYAFALEAAQKFPTEALAPNVVRIFLYVYAPGSFGLEDYGLRIVHNGAELASESRSTGGLPDVTREEPGPYTRFTNLNVIVVEAQAGNWIIQLVNADGTPVGPAAEFELTAGEDTRELYVRYRLDTE